MTLEEEINVTNYLKYLCKEIQKDLDKLDFAIRRNIARSEDEAYTNYLRELHSDLRNYSSAITSAYSFILAPKDIHGTPLGECYSYDGI